MDCGHKSCMMCICQSECSIRVVCRQNSFYLTQENFSIGCVVTCDYIWKYQNLNHEMLCHALFYSLVLKLKIKRLKSLGNILSRLVFKIWLLFQTWKFNIKQTGFTLFPLHFWSQKEYVAVSINICPYSIPVQLDLLTLLHPSRVHFSDGPRQAALREN